MYVAIDFDGTIVEHSYPAIGKPVPHALDVMKILQDAGYQLILWTMRSGEELREAVDYCTNNGINLYGINNNPTQSSWTTSPKCYAQIYIDDAALGCPLTLVKDKRPYVDWWGVKELLQKQGIID